MWLQRRKGAVFVCPILKNFQTIKVQSSECVQGFWRAAAGFLHLRLLRSPLPSLSSLSLALPSLSPRVSRSLVTHRGCRRPEQVRQFTRETYLLVTTHPKHTMVRGRVTCRLFRVVIILYLCRACPLSPLLSPPLALSSTIIAALCATRRGQGGTARACHHRQPTMLMMKSVLTGGGVPRRHAMRVIFGVRTANPAFWFSLLPLSSLSSSLLSSCFGGRCCTTLGTTTGSATHAALTPQHIHTHLAASVCVWVEVGGAWCHDFE